MYRADVDEPMVLATEHLRNLNRYP